MIDTYKTIDVEGEGLYKEKGSKFISIAIPVQSESEIKIILERYRKQYYDARHVCYAYRLGYTENSPYRMNDDGEPSGTAGKPIYGQILSQEITNVLIIVVRYFGGTKLGVSGLITAYKAAALDAIQNTDIVEKICTELLTVSYDFSLTNEAMRIVKDHNINVKGQTYDTACHLTVEVRLKNYETVKKAFVKIYGITIDSDNNEEN